MGKNISAIIHLEPKELVETMYQVQRKIRVHAYVLDCHIATMIYMFDDKNGNTYYLDRPFTACPEVIKKMGKQCIHADMYRKVALFH